MGRGERKAKPGLRDVLRASLLAGPSPLPVHKNNSAMARKSFKLRDTKLTRAWEREDYERAMKNLTKDLQNAKKKTNILFQRLENALNLVRKQRRRITEISSGSIYNSSRRGYVCKVCETKHETLPELTKHGIPKSAENPNTSRKDPRDDDDEDLDFL